MKVGKNRFIKFGVRQKVLLLLMSVLLLALTVSGWLALQAEKKSILQEIQQRGTDISRFVAKSLAYSVIGYDYHTIDLLLNEITTAEDIGYAKVINLRGNTMAESGDSGGSHDGSLVLFKEKIIIDDNEIGELTLGLSTATTLSRLEEQKYSLIKREAFIIFLIAFGEFLALSFIIIKPVSIISKSLTAQPEDDDQIIGHIPLTSNDEFGDLARHFNKLSKNLNEATSELKSRANFADMELIKTNLALQEQSEELHILNDKFRNLSLTDPLTGLFNRRHFDDVMDDEIRLSTRHKDTNSLIMIDIDNFKHINDTYGHEMGDIVIKRIAHIMRKRLRMTDILFRVGGDEFIALCRRAEKGSAITLAESLREAIENTNVSNGIKRIPVTVSIGIATLTAVNIDTHSGNFYKYTDMALYHSKETGRNKVTHFDDINFDRVQIST